MAEKGRFAVANLCHYLGVKLLMLNRFTRDGGFHYLAEETTRTRRVGQKFRHVRRTDECRRARHLRRHLAAPFLYLDLRQLHEVLQRSHLTLGIAVELVHVDERVFPQIKFGLGVCREVELVGEIGAQTGRQKHAAERTFSHALTLADQQRSNLTIKHYHGILLAEPALHRTAQPAAENALPEVVTGDTRRQFADAVATVPLGQGGEIGTQGVELGYVLGQEIGVDAAAEAVGIGLLHAAHDGIVGTHAHGFQPRLGVFPVPHLGVLRHDVEPYFPILKYLIFHLLRGDVFDAGVGFRVGVFVRFCVGVLEKLAEDAECFARFGREEHLHHLGVGDELLKEFKRGVCIFLV